MANRPPASRGCVIIPAHNEERSIGRTLRTAHRGSSADRPRVVVVCNGCTDATVEAARRISTELEVEISVLDIAEPSKQVAMKAGDDWAGQFGAAGYPRIYLDADVEIDGDGLTRLLDALEQPGVEAAAPRREIDYGGGSILVRAYYAVWLQLPSVRDGLFGRGVIAMTQVGHERVLAQPALMSDDLGLSEAFTDAERTVVDAATVRIRAPRTARDLLRRRIRVVTGNAQADDVGVRRPEARTTSQTLLAILRRRPTLAPAMVVFVAFTVLARRGSRRAVRAGDFTTWLRDESSRA